MNTDMLQTVIRFLKNRNIVFEERLSDAEYNAVVSMFGISFPYDLKCFLQTALPVSAKFVNWSMALIDTKAREYINERLLWPLEGILFDVHNNEFWYDEWGKKPDDIETQTKTVEEYYKKYPPLIPIYSHRYIPAFPAEEGNPVFSVYQSDIIYYGYDLISYLCNEFRIKLLEYNIPEKPKYIEFWGKLVSG
jgi:hypothetical protein